MFRVKECYQMLKSVKGSESVLGITYIHCMKLNPKTIWAIIALSVVALIGIVWLQVQLLMNAAEQKEEAFRQSVAAALVSVTQKLETDETVGQFLTTSMERLNTRTKTVTILGAPESLFLRKSVTDTSALDWHMRSPDKTHNPPSERVPLQILGNKIEYIVPKIQHIRLRVFDMLGQNDTVLVDATKRPGVYTLWVDTTRFGSAEHTYHYTADSLSFIVSVAHGNSGMEIARTLPPKKREESIRRVFDKLVVAEGLPVERRLSPKKLDSVVAITLRESGIDLPYAYGVISVKRDTVRMMKSAEYASELKRSEFKSRLYPGDLFAERNDLVLFFPDRKVFLMKQMSPMIGATVVFVLTIVFGFGYTIRTVFKQKRMATHMVDFINNMTHEFKTPISTISLASEAIARPDVLANADKVIRYNEVIHDENTRMRHQVEKILQMAVLEEGDYELKLAPVDVHEIIKSAAANIALQIESKQGMISMALNASAHIINADPVHIANIINNLLENAHKYSPALSSIEIATDNVANSLVVRVSDKGIGMSSEDVKRAFDKYFRVPTGNQHDVKGFGLGLSYVKLMVEAHKGTVKIASELGKGTVVETTFPEATAIE